MLEMMIAPIAQKVGLDPKIVQMILPIATKLLMQRATPSQSSGLLNSLPSNLTGMFSEQEKKEFTTSQKNLSDDEIIDQISKETNISDKTKVKGTLDEVMGLFNNKSSGSGFMGDIMGQSKKFGF